MERVYYSGGKPRRVSQNTKIRAVKESQGYIKTSEHDLLTHQAIEREWVENFSRAGWSFKPGNGGYRVASLGTVLRSLSDRGDFPDQGVLLATDRLTVKFSPDLSHQDVQAKLEDKGLSILRQLRFSPNLFEVQMKPGSDVLNLAEHLHNESGIVYAEPVLISDVSSRQRFTPNDPDYKHQWQLNNSLRRDIRAELAWGYLAEYGRGKGIRVAVIDTGFDTNHKDLNPNIANGSGYFLDDGTFVEGLTGYPQNEHGTFCAGIIGARGNNAIGVCGVAFESDLLLVSCLPDQVGSQVTLARAIAYAADPSLEVESADPKQGADIIVCSLGPNDSNRWGLTSALKDAITFATTRGRNGLGTPIFWAVSNRKGPVNQDEVVSQEGVIAVGRSNKNDIKDGSAFGSTLDFLAPGVDVYSTKDNNKYGLATGTSFAAPCAAGVAALMLSAYPRLTRLQIQQIMRETCDKIGQDATYNQNGFNENYGFGRINAERAVKRVLELRQQRGNGGY